MPSTLVAKCSSIYDAAALVERDAGLLEAEAFGVGPAADGDQHDVGLDRLGRAARGRLDGDLRALAGWCRRAVDLGAELEARCPACRGGAGPASPTSPSMPGRMRSRNSTTVTSAAEPPPDRAELEADHAGADHDQLASAPRRAPARRWRSRCASRRSSTPGRPGDFRAGGDDDALRLQTSCVLPSSPR